jgi:type VI secretion system protein ImpG
MLSLYDVVRSAETTAKVQGLKEVHSQRVTRRLRTGAVSGIGRGMEVTMEFDEQRFADNGLFLFSSLLERFLPLYGSINSFTQLVAKAPQRENGVVYRWPPRSAEKPLL